MKNKLLLTMILASMLLGVTGCGNQDNDLDDNFDNPSHLPGDIEPRNDVPEIDPDDNMDDFDEGDYPEP